MHCLLNIVDISTAFRCHAFPILIPLLKENMLLNMRKIKRLRYISKVKYERKQLVALIHILYVILLTNAHKKH